jgi:hypothetical protein
MKLKVIIIALLILISTAISGCLSGSEQTPEQTAPPADLSEEKENSEAGVTIIAFYLGNNAFGIKMDTHSGSLDYEMAKISYIRDRKGNIIKPEAWDGGIGGHHFEGTLKFPKFDDRVGFELVIQDIAEVKERILKW